MALKPGTIKALFGKLAWQYGDDIVEGAAKYGDDVVSATAPYVDDVAEDATRLLNYYNKNVEWTPHLHRNAIINTVDNSALNQALQAKTGYVYGMPAFHQADSGVLKKMTDYALRGNVLGSGVVDDATRSKLYKALETAVDVAPESIEETPWFIKGWGRPHKNTALGRWYSKYGNILDLDDFEYDLDY